MHLLLLSPRFSSSPPTPASPAPLPHQAVAGVARSSRSCPGGGGTSSAKATLGSARCSWTGRAGTRAAGSRGLTTRAPLAKRRRERASCGGCCWSELRLQRRLCVQTEQHLTPSTHPGTQREGTHCQVLYCI
ncbi:Hypothetical predicted protein [Pelobates cultripes]|uniref:Uncharacterized protein n=1 Tax=Pelobates cultripes TaxID=61616 RepID=A0AAD1RV71_PELCU|nr:Hypothetical predicted protein [Pelobates cultripes]